MGGEHGARAVPPVVRVSSLGKKSLTWLEERTFETHRIFKIYPCVAHPGDARGSNGTEAHNVWTKYIVDIFSQFCSDVRPTCGGAPPVRDHADWAPGWPGNPRLRIKVVSLLTRECDR